MCHEFLHKSDMNLLNWKHISARLTLYDKAVCDLAGVCRHLRELGMVSNLTQNVSDRFDIFDLLTGSLRNLIIFYYGQQTKENEESLHIKFQKEDIPFASLGEQTMNQIMSEFRGEFPDQFSFRFDQTLYYFRIASIRFDDMSMLFDMVKYGIDKEMLNRDGTSKIRRKLGQQILKTNIRYFAISVHQSTQNWRQID